MNIMQPCRLEDLAGWLEDEAASIQNEANRRVILEVNANIDSVSGRSRKPDSFQIQIVGPGANGAIFSNRARLQMISELSLEARCEIVDRES
jgi:hypothetical protein